MLAALQTLLFAPSAYFERHGARLDGLTGFAIALGVALVLTLVIGASLYGLSAQMTGTTTINNPDRPSDAFCSSAPTMLNETDLGCDEPETVERDTGALFWSYASGQLPVLFVGMVFVWAGLVVGLHVATLLVGRASGSVGATASVAAHGLLASVLPTAVGGVLFVFFAGQADLGASEPAQFLAQFRTLTRGISGLALGGIQLTGLAWQWYVWQAGLARAHDLSKTAAGVAAGGVGVVLGLLALL